MGERHYGELLEELDKVFPEYLHRQTLSERDHDLTCIPDFQEPLGKPELILNKIL